MLYTNSAEKCSNVTRSSCKQSSSVRSKCCLSCPALETPWLGPDCPYGDQADWCTGLSAADCSVNGQVCCDTCCQHNGPADGYSCVASSTTSRATESSGTAVTTPTTVVTTPTTVITTTVPTTTTTLKPARGFRTRQYQLTLRTSIPGYRCDDAALQDANSNSFKAVLVCSITYPFNLMLTMYGCNDILIQDMIRF